MRITHDMLMKVAQDTVTQQTRANRMIVAAFLHGSILIDAPLIGNTTDIDLFFVHDDECTIEREIVRITDDVHLDIAHLPRRTFRQARELRLHPWWGPTIYGGKILYDPQHFLDFIQASVRGQYERSDHVLGRTQPWIEQARQIWLSFEMGEVGSAVEQVARYLLALELSSNAIALLSGDPLTERRFLLDFPGRAAAIERPGLMAGLMGLLGASQFHPDAIRDLIKNWSMTFDLAQNYAPPSGLVTARKNYYVHAFDAFVSSEQATVALWPLLNSWTKLISLVPADTDLYNAWHGTCNQINLLGNGFSEKVEALDAFLDLVEETLEQWAQANGA